MGKTINQLTAVSDITATNNNHLLPLCDPGTGVSGKMTVGQAKTVFATQKIKYVATGAEGVTLTIPEVADKEILSVAREGFLMYEVVSAPDSVEFIFDGTDITLGLATNPNERFLIQYKNA